MPATLTPIAAPASRSVSAPAREASRRQLAKPQSRASRLALLLFFISLFAGCLFLYTRHNDFPSYYHEDEPGKAWQILKSDRRRERHPPPPRHRLHARPSALKARRSSKHILQF